jgi:hypothetical protein
VPVPGALPAGHRQAAARRALLRLKLRGKGRSAAAHRWCSCTALGAGAARPPPRVFLEPPLLTSGLCAGAARQLRPGEVHPRRQVPGGTTGLDMRGAAAPHLPRVWPHKQPRPRPARNLL